MRQSEPNLSSKTERFPPVDWELFRHAFGVFSAAADMTVDVQDPGTHRLSITDHNTGKIAETIHLKNRSETRGLIALVERLKDLDEKERTNICFRLLALPEVIRDPALLTMGAVTPGLQQASIDEAVLYALARCPFNKDNRLRMGKLRSIVKKRMESNAGSAM